MTGVYWIAENYDTPFSSDEARCMLKNVPEPNLYFWSNASLSDKGPGIINAFPPQLTDTEKQARALAQFEIARRERVRHNTLMYTVSVLSALVSGILVIIATIIGSNL